MKSFIPPVAISAMNSLISNVIGFSTILIFGSFVAMLLARQFGGKSKDKRVVIFKVVVFIGACIGAYIFLMPHQDGSNSVQTKISQLPQSKSQDAPVAQTLKPKTENSHVQQAEAKKIVDALQPHYEKIFVKGRSSEECKRADGVIDNAVTWCMNDHYETRQVTSSN